MVHLPLTAVVVTTMTLCAFSAAADDPRALSFSGAESLIDAAIERKELPGAVLLVGKKSGVIYEKAFGRRALQPAPEPMTTETLFDLASLSKPIGTNTCAMILIDRGQI